METPLEKSGVVTRFTRLLVVCGSLFLVIQLISLDLSWQKQAVLGCAMILFSNIANRFFSSRVVTIALMLLSMIATLRYGWWRVSLLFDYFSDQSNHRVGLDSVFMLILISAEAYTVVIMVLGYMQTAWPLKRRPILLPNDDTSWPHVDILIPTYNEPLSLVRYTALAANNIDYPPDKLHVYILDDGSRENFRQFAREAGVGYVTREEHAHAKAGNINHALATMDSPYVTIFDCDHVPTRSFLQMTLGWLLADSTLAMVQTPHHFYSPDPFERNLLQYKTIPSEAELFYGIVQDGNDFWNATFFCGSCALIRRSALDAVGGIATETVTEDAHTSLRMQKLGYGTAYINIPQAAGLATETLAAHVGQRIRWARGMIQIFRTDNPLFARGMKFTQRLCYLNAMIHFLYAVPRLVFLCAPLVYMLLGRTIIPGYWLAILAYSFPHLILSSLTNSRVQGRHRHSFWNEIYESVLAPYILAPTLLALINPKLGKFNVTDKGNTLSKTKFDGKIAIPTKWLLLLNLLGVLVAPYRIFIKDPNHPGTVIMNLVWILFNMVILGVAAAVAHEQKQMRRSVRIEVKIPMRLRSSEGRELSGMTVDMSVGGASIRLPRNEHFAIGDRFTVAFPEHAGDAEINAKVVGMRGGEIRLSFSAPTIAEQETLTRALYSRADAWLTSQATKEVDRPLKSLGRVIVLSFYGIFQICRSYFPERQRAPKTRAAQTAAVLALLCALVAHGMAFGASTLLGKAHTVLAVVARNPEPQASSGPVGVGPTAFAPDATTAPSLQGANWASNIQTIRLKDMGVSDAIELRGPHSYYSARFTLSNALVPRQATLKLLYSFDPTLDGHAASLRVALNSVTIVTLQPPASGSTGGFVEADIPVPEDQLVRYNTFTFEFTGSGVMQREDQVRAHVLGRISVDSKLDMSGNPLKLHTDLSQLPLPIFDSELQTTTTISVVFVSQPSPKALEAAGIVASWLGLIARSKPVRFAVSTGQIPSGNAIVFSDNRSSLPTSLHIPAGTGPLLAIRTNPADEYGTALVLAGDDDEQLLTVARTLSLTRKAERDTAAQGLPLNGDTAQIPDLVMPDPRRKGDAPRWLPIDRTAHLADCQMQNSLQTDGSGPIPIYFHVPPDLFYGERQNLKLHLFYRYSAPQAAPGSMLRVVVNGVLVNEAELAARSDMAVTQRLILVPIVDMRPFGNTILFNFDFAPANREQAQAAASAVAKGQILCTSSIDLHGLSLWTPMPNLELFANAGFPFTQRADLSETTVVLPSAPSSDEVSLYLDLMGHFGEQTGYPVLRLTVAGPEAVISDGRDYLILGSVENQPAFASLDALLPVTLDASGVHVKQADGHFVALASSQGAVLRLWTKLLGKPAIENRPSNDAGVPDALVEEIESPSSADRSIVLIALARNSAADGFAGVLLERSQSRDVTGSVSVLQNSQFASFRLDGDRYHVGNISWFAMMRIWLTQYFLLLLLVVTALSFLLALWVREWLSAHARERLKLAEPTEATESVVQ